MSIKEFSEALKSEAVKSWFQRLSTDSILKTGVKELRKEESGAEYNSFYITKNTISEMVAKLKGVDTSQVPQAEVDAIFKKLSTIKYGQKQNRSGKLISEPYVDGTGLYFPSIPMSGIANILNKAFSDITELTGKKIADYYEQGHVYGLFPKKVATARQSLLASSVITNANKKLLGDILTNLEKELMEQDLATSNLKTNKFSLYAKYEKRPNRYLVEMQLKEVNQSAGTAQSPISVALRKYFNPGKVTWTNGGAGAKFGTGSGEVKLKELIENSVEKLVGTRGSPSQLELIELAVAEAIRGKKDPRVATYSVNYTKIAESKAAKIDTSKVKAKIQADLKEVRKAKAELQKAARPRVEIQSSLTSLQLLLDASLVGRIKENMQSEMDYANGSRKLLTNRTGRFAESVEVQRLTQSRTGMITAFYTYMKNPYATFTTGGLRQYPRSRDPKLLISKSIREIAASQAFNNLRAVNV